MYSIIKYFGGKGSMFQTIMKYFPPNYNTYIEPFGGSFSVGLHNNISPIEIYNDLDKNVYSLFKVLSDKDLYTQFKEKCDLAYYNEDLRCEYKTKLKEELSVLDRAFYFFYVNRTSHNGVGGLSINLCIRRNMSKSISDMLSCIDGLEQFHQRLSKVLVLNTDGVSLISKYSTENVFIYADPPYEQSTRTSARYDTDMNKEQHIEFIDACLLSKAKILISGYNCELYDKLNCKFKRVDFKVNTIDGNRNPKIKTESLWMNYNNEFEL